MPIRKDLRHFYTGPAWRETRKRILERAKNKCEQCRKPNHRKVWRVAKADWNRAGYGWGVTQDNDQIWSLVKGDGQRWYSCAQDGCETFVKLRGRQWLLARQIRVVLTIAHLNHTSGDDRDENLKALCCWCHLNYDKLHHKETRIIRKDAERAIQWEGAIAV